MGSNSSKVEANQKQELINGLEALEKRLNSKVEAQNNQKMLDQLLESSIGLTKQVSQISSSNSSLKEDILQEVSRIREEQQESMNQSQLRDTRMEEEIQVQLTDASEKISKEQFDRLEKQRVALTSAIEQTKSELKLTQKAIEEKAVKESKAASASVSAMNEKITKELKEHVAEKVETVNSALAARLLKLEKEYATSSQRLAQMDSLIASIQENSKKDSSITTTLTSKLGDVESKLTALSSKVDAAANLSNQEKSQATNNATEIAAMRKDILGFKASILRLEKAIESMQHAPSSTTNSKQVNGDITTPAKQNAPAEQRKPSLQLSPSFKGETQDKNSLQQQSAVFPASKSAEPTTQPSNNNNNNNKNMPKLALKQPGSEIKGEIKVKQEEQPQKKNFIQGNQQGSSTSASAAPPKVTIIGSESSDDSDDVIITNTYPNKKKIIQKQPAAALPAKQGAQANDKKGSTTVLSSEVIGSIESIPDEKSGQQNKAAVNNQQAKQPKATASAAPVLQLDEKKAKKNNKNRTQ